MPSPSAIPRPEYPRPQFVRGDWLNLNGTWQFEFDRGDSGIDRGLTERDLNGEITVPFCPESELSGIGETDFLEAVWYRRTVTVPADWAGRTVLLHFQAVDYDTTVWVNGTEVVRHRGGFTPFTADLGDVATAGEEITIVVRARDPKGGPQARGKQAVRYANTDCHYTRTTGIWQTVWLEPVATDHLKRPRITPDLAGSAFHLELPLTGNRPGYQVRAVLSDAEGEVVSATARADLDLAPRLHLPVPAERRRVWSTDDPHLYDLRFELLDADGTVVDSADSYAGLRSVGIDGKAITLNGKKVFQRLVLDQGWYPDGLMTAPSDEALLRDIELSLEAGFNGARLHQKVFEERFLYHADRLGYLVWGEFGDWGCNMGGRPDDRQQPDASYVSQWLEAVERDYSHPSIIGWCPLNETFQELNDRIGQLDVITRGMFLATKAMDTTRPVLDASGYSHRVPETDVWDSHNYEQDPAKFAEQVGGLSRGEPHTNFHEASKPWSLPYAGQPYFVSEFGGIWWCPETAAEARGDDRTESWGYGDRPRDEEDFQVRFAGLTGVLLEDPDMFGYCYTQLTDVFQEQNGVYRFDRSVKLDVERVRAAQLRPAAIEDGEE
ncbi:Glycosyl hydrolases family 2, TIM barrel domain [Streptomyces zhaozhouensis]|uniref:Glycosyl hydrolases family 2, TIM barrel domain n=1 Tax=Streptomyces zhaozhouensis TaxID=1300267 RepID=A0A286DK97_9ACTN|nr:sugar-binding domain-containing protein [Streptomyces zhaozhouensis]SOD59177.1 Glycosyl hydrolases family 2, TIM barrel domain [Streptomyces zhaozhouensis]